MRGWVTHSARRLDRHLSSSLRGNDDESLHDPHPARLRRVGPPLKGEGEETRSLSPSPLRGGARGGGRAHLPVARHCERSNPSSSTRAKRWIAASPAAPRNDETIAPSAAAGLLLRGYLQRAAWQLLLGFCASHRSLRPHRHRRCAVLRVGRQSCARQVAHRHRANGR